MFDHLLESSHRDDSNKWSNIEFDEEIGMIEIKICILSGALLVSSNQWIAGIQNGHYNKSNVNLWQYF